MRAAETPKAKATIPIINKRVRFIAFRYQHKQQLPAMERARSVRSLAQKSVRVKTRYARYQYQHKIRSGKIRRRKALLNGAGYVRKHIVRVRADQPNGPDHDDQNDGEHYGVFRNVLAFVVAP